MKKLRNTALVIGLFFVFASSAFSITWFDQDFTCPIDNTKNTFMVIGSYGSYIYSYPSKYQWLFFPATDNPTFYICKKCHLSTFMWDFDKLPKEKLPEIKKILDTVKVSKAFNSYTEIPVIERLEIMEKVYSVLGKNDEWWENFYRIKGYHYGAAGKSEKAAIERRRALEILAKQLSDDKSTQPKKLLLYISGAMKHFLSDDKGALADFETALTTKYFEQGAKKEDLDSAEKGINERLTDYIGRVKSVDKKPRLFEMKNEDHGH